MAMDAQGAERARPYVEKAGATFETVVDEENTLGQLYGFRAIPNGFLIDEPDPGLLNPTQCLKWLVAEGEADASRCFAEEPTNR